MKKIGIVFTSRNNYSLLDHWLNVVDTEDFDVLNIDEDSSEENKKEGKVVCEKHGAVYMDREGRGMSHNIATACNYYKKQGVDWVLWFSHDSFPATTNFFSKINELVSTGNFDDFGVIGFNGHHSSQAIAECKSGIRSINHVGRTCFWGDGWYRKKIHYSGSRPIFENYDINTAFSVESVCWFAAMVNVEMYESNVVPTDDFHLFVSWDDIAFQFLAKNVYNICVPSLDIIHDRGVKTSRGYTLKSPSDNGKRDFYYGKWGHHERWTSKWGFPYETYKDRNVQKNNLEKYKGTLIWDHYNHDPKNGPMKVFDILGNVQ